MARVRSPASLLLFWSVVSCLVVHNFAESAGLVLRESLESEGQADNWEARGEPVFARASDDWDNQMCLDAAGVVTACDAGATSQQWVYKRLHGGTLATAEGNKCLTRKDSSITVEECNDSAGQKWKRMCGAWANGDGASGRVLEFTGKEGELEAKVRAAQWTGDAKQLWHFKEVVHHSRCDQKAHKVMSFDGSTQSTVVLRSFLSMPSEVITVGMWVKGSSGTPFSYGSKHHADAFTLRNLKSLEVVVKDVSKPTGIDFTSEKWTHLAVSWNSASGDLRVFKDGKQVYSSNVQRGKKITQGGCLWVGQRQKVYCKTHSEGDSFKGSITDVQVWREELNGEQIEKMMTHPVDQAILDKLGKVTDLKTPNNQRIALLSRQYNGEDMKAPQPEMCKLDAFKKKDTPKLPQVGGHMHTFTGSGDVHYRNFAREGGGPCHFDDQSVGEWVLSMVLPKYYQAAPLMIQFRTNPSKTNCAWCQNGAVSYIDGCALKYGDEQVSAGFGGFHFPGVAGIDGAGPGQYPPYAAFQGKSFSGHRRGKNIQAWRHGNSLRVDVMSHGISLNCRRHSISLRMPNTFKGKVAGIAGMGLGKNHDWMQGPNTKVYAAAQPWKQMPGLAGQCPRHYVYGNREHPFNGNRADKPLYKWFRTWQVDGELIPSAFYYTGNTGPGSFNRNAGQKVKTIRNSNDRPNGTKKAAIEHCKLLRATPEARQKCVFDFMVLGPKAIKDSQRDRMAQRAAKIKTPTTRDVRDVTKFSNDATWAGKPGWDCGDDFRQMQVQKAKEHEDMWATRKADRRQKDAEKFAPCPAGFSVIAEQTDMHTQETKKCHTGMMALSRADVKKTIKGGKKGKRQTSQAQSFWETDGPKAATTQMLSDNCFGIGCVASKEAKFASSSGTAIFASGRTVAKSFKPADEELGESSQSASRALLSTTTESSEESESETAMSDLECRDSNRDKSLSCAALKGSCGTELVQSTCAATCGTPWAGDTECKAKANALKNYQCKPASVCQAPDTAVLPVGFRWEVRPRRSTMRMASSDSHCQAKSSIGIARCDLGKPVTAQYQKGNQTVSFQARCGCDGGFKLVASRTSSMDDACTPYGQKIRSAVRSKINSVYEDYELKAAAWIKACSPIKKSVEKFSASTTPLAPVKTGAAKPSIFASNWRFKPVHLKNVYKFSENKKCSAQFKLAMWACDTGPMRDVVSSIPGQGFSSMQLGCGCQQLRAQASYSGMITKMADQSAETQKECSQTFMEWNTEFQKDTWGSYSDSVQALSDEMERQCMKTTLELNNVPAQKARHAYNTKLILEENTALVGRLSSLKYKLQLDEAANSKVLNRCKKKHFVLEGLPMYERKTKELAKTADRKRAATLSKELQALKSKLDAHEQNPEGEEYS